MCPVVLQWQLCLWIPNRNNIINSRLRINTSPAPVSLTTSFLAVCLSLLQDAYALHARARHCWHSHSPPSHKLSDWDCSSWPICIAGTCSLHADHRSIFPYSSSAAYQLAEFWFLSTHTSPQYWLRIAMQLNCKGFTNGDTNKHTNKNTNKMQIDANL